VPSAECPVVADAGDRVLGTVHFRIGVALPGPSGG